MASSSLLPSAGKSLLPESPLFRSGEISPPKSFTSIPNSGFRSPRIRASSATVAFPLTAREKVGVLSDNLDGWMRESVVEIVKGLKNSPLLLHVYCNEMKPEKTGWERRSPDGIILVQQLEENNMIEFEGDARLTSVQKSRETVSVKTEDEGTKAWGVLVQGKGMGRECTRTACYLLKTCRVNSGLGLCGTTHFSLVKVKNFRESAFSQIKSSWLL